jgi:hypothetical protein
MVTGLQSSWSMVIKKLMVFFIKYFVDFLWQLFYFQQKMAQSRGPAGTVSGLLGEISAVLTTEKS